MVDPVIALLLCLGAFIIALASGMIGHNIGFYNGFERARSKIEFWASEAMKSGQEIRKLQKINKEYAPYKNPEDGRWHCPRTGEYVDEDDVINEIRQG